MPVEPFFMWWYNPKGGGKDFLSAHHRQTMGLRSWGQGVPPQGVWLSHTPITKTADLKGKKFRTAGVWAQILNEKFGGAGTAIPGSELFVMMERKALDITEWSGPSENSKIELLRHRQVRDPAGIPLDRRTGPLLRQERGLGRAAGKGPQGHHDGL
jgi:TRAP-type mannitol/chloroaromatic compound transport system substrate-binding protein